GGKPYEDRIPRGERGLADEIRIVEAGLGNNKWGLRDDFTLAGCAYAPILHITQKAGFSYGELPKDRPDMDANPTRPGWQDTPRLPGLEPRPAVVGLNVDFGLCRTTI